MKRRRNPVATGELAERLQRAARLHKRFSGHDAETVARAPEADVFGPLTRDGKRVLIIEGTVDFIGYTTIRDGVVESYRHIFAKHARPLFAVSHDGRHLFIVGGRFKFTDRGIVDAPKRGNRS